MQNVTLRARGLFTYPNSLSEIPEGALIDSDNCVIDREGTITPRRGYKIYGNSMGGPAVRAKQLAVYKGRIIRHWSNTLDVDSDGAGTFTAFSGNISEVAAGSKIRYQEANGNFYFTTSTGIKKISVLTAAALPGASVTNSGGLKALNGQATLDLSSASGFLGQDATVAYRIVWGYKDANSNLILGVPSDRIIIANPLIDLLIADFNALLPDLNTAAAADATDKLSDVDYNTLVIPTTSSAATLLAAMQSLVTKLDTDLSFTSTATLDGTTAVLTAIPTTTFIREGMTVSGTGIPANSTVLSIDSATQITISNNTTIAGAGVAITLTNTSFADITVPAAPIEPVSTLQLEALQTYYDNICDELNTHPGISTAAKTAIGGAFTFSTQSANTTLTFVVPSAATLDYFYQVYRSSQAISEGPTSIFDVVPDDEMRLIYENFLTAGELSALSVTYADAVPDTFRDGGANLYTNANTGEGILQANEPPPIARDIALYKGYTFYANTKTRHKRQLSLLGVSALVGQTLTITKGVSTLILDFDNVENPATQQVLVSTAATPAQQVDETARSIVNVINKQPTPIVYAYYVSGVNDVPGLIVLESSTLDTTAFSITSSAGASDNFSPELPVSGTSVISDNEVSPNRLYYSKYQQPEAVPLLNYIDIGPKDSEILRIMPLRESLFIITQAEVYRLGGEVSTSFSVSSFDNSTTLVAPDSCVALNNQVFILTDQGVATVSDTGVVVVSRAIEGDFLPLLGEDFINFSSVTFAVAYESDRAYMLWTVQKPTDTVPTVCYRYNTFTQTWMKWQSSKTAAVVNPANDKLYLGAGDTNSTEIERKDFTRLDHADREFTRILSLGDASGNILNLGSVFNFDAGDVVVQTQYLTISQFNRLLKRLDTDLSVQDSDYFSTLAATSGDQLKTNLLNLATKLDADPGITTTTFFATVFAYGNTSQDEQSAFNAVVTLLNNDATTQIKTYKLSTGTVEWEVKILSVEESTNNLTMAYDAPLIAGNIIQYKHINSFVVWAPMTFSDVSTTKQISEGTIIFENVGFDDAVASYATDLSPNFEDIAFQGEGTGIWGNFAWGQTSWGGEASARPFRTYIPRQKQRGRYINCRYDHSAAFEKYAIFGISYTYNATSHRGYR